MDPTPPPRAPLGKGPFSAGLRWLLDNHQGGLVNNTPGVRVTRSPAGTSLRVKPVPPAAPAATGGDGYWR